MQQMSVTDAARPRPARFPLRRVLNTGCGPYSKSKLHPVFQNSGWQEVRLDIDPAVQPNIVGSVTDMRNLVRDRSMDAIWSSHNLEHLHGHEVTPALAEFRRVLNPAGFALIATPNLSVVARLIVDGRAENVAYTSAAGPITALDMLFGYGESIKRGNRFMAHHTGFTSDRLGRLILEAGFVEAMVTTDMNFDLWAIALMPNANRSKLVSLLQTHGVNFSN